MNLLQFLSDTNHEIDLILGLAPPTSMKGMVIKLVKDKFHTRLRALLEEVIKDVEERKKPIMVVGVPKDSYATYDGIRVEELLTHNSALSSLASHLREEINKIKV